MTRGIKYTNKIITITDGKPQPAAQKNPDGREKTIAYKILRTHNKAGSEQDKLRVKFDALISHDITYVSIIQTARASGMTSFPVPYALSNCHNSLCAVGGTINEDDHAFGLSAAVKYGGIYVPANQAVIHQYAREQMAACGSMILGSDSHTRYGCYGTLGIGEGGGELVKQLLVQTYDITPPEVVLIWIEGTPRRGVGPHDVALALIRETFPEGKVKNKILEFAGPGVSALSMDYRAGIDVMTTETSCLSSIWETDDTVKAFYDTVGRSGDYKELKTEDGAVYDAMVTIDLSQIEPMIALPFHPGRAYTIHELQENPKQILQQVQELCTSELGTGVNPKLDLLSCINDRGEIMCHQGIIVGCAGGMFENISQAADILGGRSIGNGYFDLSVYPSSMPVSLDITTQGISETLIKAGAVIKPAFCGPCFGAGDTPAHNTLSIRHATRNFASREGSKPADGQIASVALMDARSVAATAARGGILTAATDIDYEVTPRTFTFDKGIYEKRCYNGFGRPQREAGLRFGPNIADWPEFTPLKDNLLVKICAVIRDDVTTTDELIPSGDTSSYRSNPAKLAEFTLSRRVPDYVRQSKAVLDTEGELEAKHILDFVGTDIEHTSVGSCIFAKKPGDGSAREQAVSCQRVLGGRANISYEYATKRYRSNCINWGIIPFTIDKDETFDYSPGDWIYISNIREMLLSASEVFTGKVVVVGAAPVKHGIYGTIDITLRCEGLDETDRTIIADGCLMNYYANKEHNRNEQA